MGAPVCESEAHLVFLRSGVLLIVKRPDADWRQLQEDYPEYMASLGPWTIAEMVEFFELDYGQDDCDWPFRRQAIIEFMPSSDLLVLEG